MSDEAKRLHREEPNLFEAANREYEGKFSPTISFPFYQHIDTIGILNFRTNLNKFSFQNCPKNAQLHDLASLFTLDSKKMDPEQLGLDAIKEQQAANLKHSSSQCAIFPEDHMQVMLAGVSVRFHVRM